MVRHTLVTLEGPDTFPGQEGPDSFHAQSLFPGKGTMGVPYFF